MRRSLILTLALMASAGLTARGDLPSDSTPTTAELAARAWAITDAVLARHVDPPARQQMLLAGIKAAARKGHDPLPPGLARRVSDLTNADQFASLLAEIWAGSKVTDSKQREAAFFDGLLSAVPGGATLMSAKERKVAEQIAGNLYVGIQVALGMDEKARKPVFMQILEGGPAEHAGARAQDLIEEIDGVSAEGMPLVQVIDRLRGEEGTDVLIRFKRPSTGEVFTKPMTRGRLPRATVIGLSPLPGKRWAVRFDGPQPVGYLKINEISGSTPQELRVFAEQLESEGVKALVLDFRHVQQAGFHATILLADALLDGGTLGRVRTVDGEKTYQAEPDALFRDWPIVAIADGASSPEVTWLCQALAENKRATILGEPFTARQPVVRETVSLPGGEWSVELATGLLERADGKPLPVLEARRLPRDGFQAAEDPSQEDLLLGQYQNDISAKVPANPRFGINTMRLPRPDPLPKAREILEAALKAAAK